MFTFDKNLKRCIPYSMKAWLREKILNYYGVTLSQHGVSVPLIKRFRGGGPITLIDVGASGGEFTQGMSQLCGIKKALLIEIQPKRCEQLRQRFPQSTFQILCGAAGGSEGEMEVDILAWDFSTSLLKIDRHNPKLIGTNDFSVKESIRTKVRPLDNVCRELGFMDEIDLLKLDVQGAEGMVLEGAGEILSRVNAVWTEVSFQPLYKGSITFPEIYDLFRRANFSLMALEEAFCGADGELLQADALFVPNRILQKGL